MARKHYLIFAIIAIIGIVFISSYIRQIPLYETEEIEVKYSLIDLEVRSYLIEKYNPGLCFGMPRVVPDEFITSELNRNPDLVIFIKNRFGVSTDHEIYIKIDQLNSVRLTKTGVGYDFTFKDGRCCDIFTYEGKIRIDVNQTTDEVTNKSTEGVPC